MSSGTSFFRVEPLDTETLWVWFDVPDRPVNVLSEPVFEALHRVIDQIEETAPPKRVVFQSPKPKGFCAGADLKRVAALQEESEIEAFLRCGQEAFSRLAQLPIPTVAVIHGACLGGGLEFALACRHRLAVDEPSTKLGLPEERLGLIPGWGGTQRLPRLIGEIAALELLWTGDPVDARRAAALGLTDGILTSDDLEPARLAPLLDRLPTAREAPPVSRQPQTKDQPTILSGTPAQRAAEKLVHLNAPDLAASLAQERKLFHELITTPETRAILDGFLHHSVSH